MAKKKGLLESMSSEKQEEQKDELSFNQLEQKDEAPKQEDLIDNEKGDPKGEETKQENTKPEAPKVEETKQENTKPEEPVNDGLKTTSKKEKVERTNTNKVSVLFTENSPVVKYVLLSTQHKEKVVAAGKQLKMLKGRGYFVPVNSTVNSDEMNSIKVFSDMADKIDVRFVKDGHAFVIPLQHNIILAHDQRLALLS